MLTRVGSPAQDRTPATPEVAGDPWSRRSRNPVQLLLGVTRELEGHLAETLAEPIGRGLRPSFAPVLQLIRDGSLSVSQVAERLGISLQAASQAAVALETLGYSTRAPNPADGRSRLLVLTPEGRGVVEAASVTIAACERQYATVVGKDRLAELVADLAALQAGLGLGGATARTGRTGRTPSGRGARTERSLGVLIVLSVQARDAIVTATAASGHAGIRWRHHDVLAVVAPCGARVSAVARGQGVSRQAMSATLRELESLGYVARHRDSHDRRAVVVTLTPQGTTFGHDALRAVQDVERRYQAVLGVRRFSRMARTLTDLAAALSVGSSAPSAPLDLRAGAGDLHNLARLLRQTLGPAGTAQLAALLDADPRPLSLTEHRRPRR